jgi:hypothetical protein
MVVRLASEKWNDAGATAGAVAGVAISARGVESTAPCGAAPLAAAGPASAAASMGGGTAVGGGDGTAPLVASGPAPAPASAGGGVDGGLVVVGGGGGVAPNVAGGPALSPAAAATRGGVDGEPAVGSAAPDAGGGWRRRQEQQHHHQGAGASVAACPPSWRARWAASSPLESWTVLGRRRRVPQGNLAEECEARGSLSRRPWHGAQSTSRPSWMSQSATELRRS